MRDVQRVNVRKRVWSFPPQLAMVAALLPLPFLAMMIPVPESPTFLLAKNRFLSYSYTPAVRDMKR